MKSVCVFCGSSLGSDSKFKETAYALGKTLAQKNISLVYGGAKVGLMGVVANACLENGGKVIGVLPKFLQSKEVGHTQLTEMILCETMHERKMKMFELSEGFISLPGGFGTLEELSEILTWQQLGLHKYPIGILNVNGYYDHLSQFFLEMENKSLLKPENRKMALFHDNIADLFGAMDNYIAPDVPKWINKEMT